MSDNTPKKIKILRVCSLLLALLVLASPFIVRGMVSYAVKDVTSRNSQAAAQAQADEDNNSRLTIEFEGECDEGDGVITIYKKGNPDDNGDTETVATITPEDNQKYIDLPAGDYVVESSTSTYEIELDGETDCNLTVNCQDGTITE